MDASLKVWYETADVRSTAAEVPTQLLGSRGLRWFLEGWWWNRIHC